MDAVDALVKVEAAIEVVKYFARSDAVARCEHGFSASNEYEVDFLVNRLGADGQNGYSALGSLHPEYPYRQW